MKSAFCLKQVWLALVIVQTNTSCTNLTRPFYWNIWNCTSSCENSRLSERLALSTANSFILKNQVHIDLEDFSVSANGMNKLQSLAGFIIMVILMSYLIFYNLQFEVEPHLYFGSYQIKSTSPELPVLLSILRRLCSVTRHSVFRCFQYIQLLATSGCNIFLTFQNYLKLHSFITHFKS